MERESIKEHGLKILKSYFHVKPNLSASSPQLSTLPSIPSQIEEKNPFGLLAFFNKNKTLIKRWIYIGNRHVKINLN